MKKGLRFSVLAMGLAFSGSAMAQYFETESNDNKANANIINPAGAGFTIQGNSLGTSTTVAGAASADYFRLHMYGASLGIYQHRLTGSMLGSSVFNTFTIRGLTQSSTGINATSDTAFQTAVSTAIGTTPARTLQWYGFGKQEDLYIGVTGASTVTSDYLLTHSVTQITPTNIGSFTEGTLRIEETNTSSDMDFWIYDSNLDPIFDYGGDSGNPSGQTPATPVDTLIKPFGPGTYYIAMAFFSAGNNMQSVGDVYRSGTVTDFPGVWLSGQATASSNGLAQSVKITDSTGFFIDTPFSRTGGFDTMWFQFTVTPVPEPASMAALALGVGALAARRRRRK